MKSCLKKYIKNCRKNNFIRIVATNGCFDILHVGHLEMLKKARAMGDILIVGLNSDSSVKQLKGKERPINNQNNRKTLLEELRCVDYVYIFDSTTCEEFLSIVNPDIYVKAGDYNMDSLNEKEKNALIEAGSKIVFTNLIPKISTTSIISKI